MPLTATDTSCCWGNGKSNPTFQLQCTWSIVKSDLNGEKSHLDSIWHWARRVAWPPRKCQRRGNSEKIQPTTNSGSGTVFSECQAGLTDTYCNSFSKQGQLYSHIACFRNDFSSYKWCSFVWQPHMQETRTKEEASKPPDRTHSHIHLLQHTHPMSLLGRQKLVGGSFLWRNLSDCYEEKQEFSWQL